MTLTDQIRDVKRRRVKVMTEMDHPDAVLRSKVKRNLWDLNKELARLLEMSEDHERAGYAQLEPRNAT